VTSSYGDGECNSKSVSRDATLQIKFAFTRETNWN
jgi:hypothetical protein